MLAYHGGEGINIRLAKQDRIVLEEGGELECRLTTLKKPKLVLHIVDEVPEKGPFEEPGFHITAEKPTEGGIDVITRYDVYLSKERAHRLIHPEDDPTLEPGCFISRSMYDRIAMTYWNV